MAMAVATATAMAVTARAIRNRCNLEEGCKYGKRAGGSALDDRESTGGHVDEQPTPHRALHITAVD